MDLALIWDGSGYCRSGVIAKKCKKNAKKCTKVLHISKKSSIFASDLGIVPDQTIKYYRVMERKNALNALGEKERRLVLPIGRKKVVVYELVSGKGEGLGIVQCSLYPNLGGLFPDLESAIERANKIESFHKRQLKFTFAEQGKEE